MREMMENEIVFRKYEKKDRDLLSQMISDVWGYEQFAPRRIGFLLAQMDLLSCLENQTFSQIAERDGVPVGFIFGRKEGSCPNGKYGDEIRRTRRKILLSLTGLPILLVSRKMKKINQCLLEESGREYGAELAFFALRQEARGMGIGRELFERFCEYCRENGCGNYFVYTDSSSDYGFYEHFGLIRRGAKQFRIPGGPAVHMYLYDTDDKKFYTDFTKK